jgi:hypothetical protein
MFIINPQDLYLQTNGYAALGALKLPCAAKLRPSGRRQIMPSARMKHKVARDPSIAVASVSQVRTITQQSGSCLPLHA